MDLKKVIPLCSGESLSGQNTGGAYSGSEFTEVCTLHTPSRLKPRQHKLRQHSLKRQQPREYPQTSGELPVNLPSTRAYGGGLDDGFLAPPHDMMNLTYIVSQEGVDEDTADSAQRQDEASRKLGAVRRAVRAVVERIRNTRQLLRERRALPRVGKYQPIVRIHRPESPIGMERNQRSGTESARTYAPSFNGSNANTPSPREENLQKTKPKRYLNI